MRKENRSRWLTLILMLSVHILVSVIYIEIFGEARATILLLATVLTRLDMIEIEGSKPDGK